VSRTALRPTQPPIQRVLGALSLGVKRSGREAGTHFHLVPRSQNAWSYTSIPQYAFMSWCLVKLRNNFTFTFTVITVFVFYAETLQEVSQSKSSVKLLFLPFSLSRCL
jgi:hypothetical protein